jgi:putative transcriptional regulator
MFFRWQIGIDFFLEKILVFILLSDNLELMDEILKYEGSYAKHFLISNAMLEDPNFSETVTLLIEHNENGAFGLTINRPSQLKVKDILPTEFYEGYNQNIIYQGGPVGKNNLFYIYQSESGPVKVPGKGKLPGDVKQSEPEGVQPAMSKTLEICPNVYLGTSYELLKSKNAAIANILFFLGYSGWGPLQLEFEMTRKSWVTMKASKELVFAKNPLETWRKALDYKGGIYKFFSKHINNPDLN